jgi:hypothetical protein
MVTVKETPHEHQSRGIMHVHAVLVNGILTFPTHTRDNITYMARYFARPINQVNHNFINAD